MHGRQIIAYMADLRTRDEIWNVALVKTVMEDTPVTISMVVENTSASQRTVRETLNAMTRTPFLDRSVANDGTVRFTTNLTIADE